MHWGVDFTEGQAQDPWRNALLSNDAKELMYEMHKDDPEGCVKFRRHQRYLMACLCGILHNSLAGGRQSGAAC